MAGREPDRGREPDARRRWLAEHGRESRCPYCGSSRTERAAAFGPFHMSESYVCLECKSPFSRIRWEAPAPPSRR